MAVCDSTMSFLLVYLMGFVVHWSLAYNHVFHVGEHDGWTLLPSENYSHWAQRNRFQNNDELVFKYPKGDDSVLVVGEDDYKKCNKKNPIQTLNDGYSKFKFNRSGPFFFISGHDQRCEKGQKLIIIVLADHHHRRHPPSSAPSPSEAAKTPSYAPPLQPPSHSPSPATHKPAPPLPHSPSPSPIAKTPTYAPPLSPPSHSPSPSSSSPTHAPPSHSPTPSPSSPTHAPPSHSPSPATYEPTPPPSHSPSPPSHAPPTQPPSRSPPPPPPAPISHQSPPPEAESPEDDNAPQPDADQPVFLPPYHAPAPAPSAASVSGASFIVTVGLGVVATIYFAWIVV